MKDVKGIISSHYTSLKTFYNDHVIKEVLRHAEHHVRDLKVMMENTPFMAEIFFDEIAKEFGNARLEISPLDQW